MRLTTDRRCLVALLAAAFVVGCGGKPKSGGTDGSTSGSGGGKGGLPIAGSSGLTSAQEAEAFLKDLGDGKVGPDRLTANFKKKLAPPNKDVEVVAKEWLEQFKGATFQFRQENKIGDAIVARGLVQFPDAKPPNTKSASFSLRLVQGKADWLYKLERVEFDIKVPRDPTLAFAQDAVRNFIDLVLSGEFKQVHTLMAPAWKKSLSPPGSQDIKDGYDFGPGFLMGKTRAWKGDFTAYTLAQGDTGSNEGIVVFVATLQAGGSKTVFLVKATKDPTTGEWLVSDFEKQ